MKTIRSVVAGTVGAGKSTFVRTLSEIEVVSTDCSATDDTLLLKPETTVALDFGKVMLSPKLNVHIYGTPGQARFDFMWDVLIQNADSYILLVAAHRPSDFHYACEILSFINQRVQIPMLIGITHTDCSGALAVEDIVMSLGYNMNDKNCPPIVRVNPTDRASVIEALLVLMGFLIEEDNVNLFHTPYRQ
ncbi:MAG: ATP/GTP-binding protein [Cyanobacteriota bacterium]|nr:ATP/GTP-binding protein [Cyanobacteriota bacterium]